MEIAYRLRRLLTRPPARTLRAVAFKLGMGNTGQVSRGGGGGGGSAHAFDELYAIDAAGGESFTRSGSAADAHNVGYWPSFVSVARKGIEAVPDHARTTFVDFGCGKGRVLVLATEYPFPRVVGLELSPSLGADAQAVARTVAEKHPERRRIEVVMGDGLAFDLPPGPILLYMYHPAYAGLLKKLARKLADHQAASPDNKVFLVYANPAAAPAFDDHPGFQRFFAARVRHDAADRAANTFGTDEDSVVVWQTVSPSMYPPHPGADRAIRYSPDGDGASVVTDEVI